MLKLKLQYFGHLMRRVDSLEKTLMLGGIGGRRRRGWQRMRWLDEHEFEKAPGVGDGQGIVACYSPWDPWHSTPGRKVMTNLDSIFKSRDITLPTKVRLVKVMVYPVVMYGCESGWTPGVGDGQGGLACCNSWGRKESDTTERLNWTELI